MENLEFKLVKNNKKLYVIQYRIDTNSFLKNCENLDSNNWKEIPYYYVEDGKVCETVLSYKSIDGCCAFISKHKTDESITNFINGCELSAQLTCNLYNEMVDKYHYLYKEYKIVDIVE